MWIQQHQHFLKNFRDILDKPILEIEKLIAAFLPESEKINIEIDTKLDLVMYEDGNPSLLVLLLLEGRIDLSRSSSKDLLFSSTLSPNVFGLLGSLYRFKTFNFIARRGSVVYILPRERAIDIIIEKNLTRDVLLYHSYIFDIENKGGGIFINRTTYETVCLLLLELIELPACERDNIYAANYIIKKSKLARSGIMRIISDLRTGGYVEIVKGKLVGINKAFPLSY